MKEDKFMVQANSGKYIICKIKVQRKIELLRGPVLAVDLLEEGGDGTNPCFVFNYKKYILLTLVHDSVLQQMSSKCSTANSSLARMSLQQIRV